MVSIKRKPIEIPPEVARQFTADMKAYHAEQDDIRRDRIAVGTRHVLLLHRRAGTKLRLSEVKELFEENDPEGVARSHTSSWSEIRENGRRI
ncbi:hypothetical protein [Bradyrhizobium sp. RD5-C2]|uniref:hypothetical protein n=1 Tax=Bradyrhizobium sp. RD5-C2 TaxID=244562 RepID=UPI001CC4E5E6|nr:hypothetical protein [Bradyrhizobium sp. RD5-C2]GIQ75427.1 hypothetical protein BraRD5C2_38680 [Bradyrhizobium sp. RD5-C2]